MAGMLDMHVLAGNAQARDVLERMAAWTALWVRPIDTALMERILEREYGGMNEVLYNFAAVTGQDRWRELAERFNRTTHLRTARRRPRRAAGAARQHDDPAGHRRCARLRSSPATGTCTTAPTTSGTP